jgi:hypothetical protein
MFNAMFIGWGAPVIGRETQATKVFGEWVEMLGAWKAKGQIQSMTPCFIQARGGDLQGFFLVTGDPGKLSTLMASDEIRRAITRAQLIVNNFGCCMALTGDEIPKQMALWNQNVAELAK